MRYSALLEQRLDRIEIDQNRDRQAQDRDRQTLLDHVRRCEDRGKENTELIKTAIQKSAENAAACILKAEQVKSTMLQTVLWTAGGTIGVLVAFIEFQLKFHP